MARNPRVVIFGGTGTIGTALVERHYKDWDITVFSRDEYKQSTLAHRFPKLKFIIGDVSKREDVQYAFLPKPDYVIFAAAMKRIEKCEQHPIGAVSTNVIGAENVVYCCLQHGVRMISITTDKAVEPANVYGMTKAIQERIVTQAGFNCARYGNVFGSRGSVVPLFLELKDSGRPLTITHQDMTRFILTKEHALDLIDFVLYDEPGGRVWVCPSPSALITDIAYAIGGDVKFTQIGQGEKLHECLISAEEAPHTRRQESYICIDRSVKITTPALTGAYTSGGNKEWLTVPEIQALISQLTGNTKNLEAGLEAQQL
jgi:UDP-N-acetylglucosamine 4,6-dehydratase